jgi:hypothetical protein
MTDLLYTFDEDEKLTLFELGHDGTSPLSNPVYIGIDWAIDKDFSVTAPLGPPDDVF